MGEAVKKQRKEEKKKRQIRYHNLSVCVWAFRLNSPPSQAAL